MKISKNNHNFEFAANAFSLDNRTLIDKIDKKPFLYVGKGNPNIEMYRGNFDIEDDITERIPLVIQRVEEEDEGISFTLGNDLQELLTCTWTLHNDGSLYLQFSPKNNEWNRLWLRLKANKNEHIYGCGEQMSYFDLRGHHFPLWSSEPGVGRNKKTLTTFYADVNDHAGGDYYSTNYPEATFVSSEKYFCHSDTYVYADFDFRHQDYHELQYWGIPNAIIFETADNYKGILSQLTTRLGRQEALPDWTQNGFIAGLQGGSERVDELIKRFEESGVDLAGVWCQDWEGIRITDFGKRLFWNWAANDKLYPNLKQKIKEWEQKGIRFMGYINPYVADDAPLFADADQKGYFAKQSNGETYHVDFGGFNCGIVDFTNPKAYEWFKNLIKTNLIEIGLSGWMADFGEYLPTDVVLYDGSDPLEMHNKWPMLWAKCNYDAVHEAHKQDEIVYFMRAGATGSQKYCPLLWAGDQSVNWSLDDGIASVIPAALSAGMTGNGLTHSDIGGYTSRYGNIRSRELFMRWAEMGAFTPFMRSHEGNRPDTNFQVYNDPAALNHLARVTQVFKMLKPYRKHVIEEVTLQGIPAQRPIFMEYENDDEAYTQKYEYLFGDDVLVAPVYSQGQREWRVYLPDDNWVHMWSGKKLGGGWHTVEAPLGQVPAFYREKSEYHDLFQKIKGMVIN